MLFFQRAFPLWLEEDLIPHPLQLCSLTAPYIGAAYHRGKYQGSFLRVAPVLTYLVLGNDPAPVWSQDLLSQPHIAQCSAASRGGLETSELQFEDCMWLQCAWEGDKALCHGPTLPRGSMGQGTGQRAGSSPLGISLRWALSLPL